MVLSTYNKSIGSLLPLLFDVVVIILIWFFFVSTATMTVVVVVGADTTAASTTFQSYGVDCSFPVHHKNIRCKSLGDRQSFYNKYMDGCRVMHGFMCDAYEESRLFATAVQPQQMTVRTLTSILVATVSNQEVLISHY